MWAFSFTGYNRAKLHSFGGLSSQSACVEDVVLGTIWTHLEGHHLLQQDTFWDSWNSEVPFHNLLQSIQSLSTQVSTLVLLVSCGTIEVTLYHRKNFTSSSSTW
jgi:hypothetical protein